MFAMAVTTKSLSIGGVNKQYQQFCDFAFVMGFFGWAAASFTKVVGIGANRSRPSLPSGVRVQPGTDVFNDKFWAVALPVGGAASDKIFAHPLAFAGKGAKVVLGGTLHASRRALDHLAALVADDRRDSNVGITPISLTTSGTTKAGWLAGRCWVERLTAAFTGLLSGFHWVTSMSIITWMKQKGQACYG